MESLHVAIQGWLEPLRAWPSWLVLTVAALTLAFALFILARALKWLLYGALFVTGLAALIALAGWLV